MTTTTPKPPTVVPNRPAPVDPVGWEPAGTVYCAIILADSRRLPPQQVVCTSWASEGEARAYIERHLKLVVDERAPEMVSGFVVPASTHTELLDGELHQHNVKEWANATRAYLNSRGYVTW